MRRYWDWYAPEVVRAEPLVAALAASDAELAELPPLFLLAAGIDPLLSDTLELARRLAALGRDDDLVVVPGVIHGFLQMTNALEPARAALRRAGDAARRLIARR
jgi:acetyl esterase